jgi:hypothetical protein
MTTMTQPLEISVLSAPLEAIDRRALSEAWYSALRFAHRGSGGSATTTPRSPRSGTPSSNRCSLAVLPRSRYPTFLKKQSFEVHILRSPKKMAFLRLERPNAASASPTRRNQGPALAARIRRKLGAKTKRATVRLDGERGRVHLMLQRHGSRMRIIAICPKRIEARVARAIDEARFALASRGVFAESSVKGVQSCK